MEIKFTVDAPRRGLRRLLLFVCLPVAAVAALAFTAQALDTSWIATGQTLSSTKLKAAFDELSKQVQVSAEIAENGTIVRQLSTAGWTLNPTRSSVGNYVLSFGGGVSLSAPPICTTAPLWGRNDFIRVGGDGQSTESATSVTVRTASWSNGVPEDSGFSIVCFGTKI